LDCSSFSDATTKILLPQFEFQELEQLDANGVCTNANDPSACWTTARVTGTVLLGQGCYCEDTDPKPTDCSTTLGAGGTRKLQQQSGLSMTAIDIEFVVTGGSPVETDGTEGGCSGLIGCFIQSVLLFIALILSFLTLGLL